MRWLGVRCFLAQRPIDPNVGAPQRLTAYSLPADKILRNLLGRFPAWDLNPVSVSPSVIDEHMRTGDPRLVTLCRESLYCR